MQHLLWTIFFSCGLMHNSCPLVITSGSRMVGLGLMQHNSAHVHRKEGTCHPAQALDIQTLASRISSFLVIVFFYRISPPWKVEWVFCTIPPQCNILFDSEYCFKNISWNLHGDSFTFLVAWMTHICVCQAGSLTVIFKLVLQCSHFLWHLKS